MATTTKKGLMSAADKKYGIQYVNFPKKQSRKILQVEGDYLQFVCVGFLLSGSSPFNFILSGRSETNNRFNFNLGKINDGGSIKIYNLKSATTRLYDTEAKIICIVSKKGAQCIECHHKDI